LLRLLGLALAAHDEVGEGTAELVVRVLSRILLMSYLNTQTSNPETQDLHFRKKEERSLQLRTVGQGSILRPNHSVGSVATQKLWRSIEEEDELGDQIWHFCLLCERLLFYFKSRYHKSFGYFFPHKSYALI
jgi:hypothetical protein